MNSRLDTGRSVHTVRTGRRRVGRRMLQRVKGVDSGVVVPRPPGQWMSCIDLVRGHVHVHHVVLMRDAASARVSTAPGLLVGRPSNPPIGQACFAVVARASTATATLEVLATPGLLGRGPALLPFRILCITVVWHLGAALLSMLATPRLLVIRPASTPVGESSIAIVILRWSTTQFPVSATPGLLCWCPSLTPLRITHLAIEERLVDPVVWLATTMLLLAAPGLLSGCPSALPATIA